jgi:hypothetical protein
MRKKTEGYPRHRPGLGSVLRQVAGNHSSAAFYEDEVPGGAEPKNDRAAVGSEAISPGAGCRRARIGLCSGRDEALHLAHSTRTTPTELQKVDPIAQSIAAHLTLVLFAQASAPGRFCVSYAARRLAERAELLLLRVPSHPGSRLKPPHQAPSSQKRLGDVSLVLSSGNGSVSRLPRE